MTTHICRHHTSSAQWLKKVAFKQQTSYTAQKMNLTQKRMTMSLKLPPVQKMHNYSWVVALTVWRWKNGRTTQTAKRPESEGRPRALPESMNRWPAEKGESSPTWVDEKATSGWKGEASGPYQIEVGGWRVTCHGWALYTCIILSNWWLIYLYSLVRMVDVQWRHFCSSRDSKWLLHILLRDEEEFEGGGDVGGANRLLSYH